MKKLCEVCIWLIISLSFGQAHSETKWTLVGSAPGDSEIYVDVSRLKREKNVVRAWVLYNNQVPKKLPNGQTWVSMITQEEIDCAETTSRNLSTFLFSELDGKGSPVASSNEPEKVGNASPPDSAGDKLQKLACEITRRDSPPHEVVLKCTLVYGALFMSSRKAENTELLAYSQDRVRVVAPRVQSYEGNASIQENYKQIAKTNGPLIETLERDFYDAIVTRNNQKFTKALKEVSACDRKLGIQESSIPKL